MTTGVLQVLNDEAENGASSRGLYSPISSISIPPRLTPSLIRGLPVAANGITEVI